MSPSTNRDRLWLWVGLAWVLGAFFRVFLDPHTRMSPLSTGEMLLPELSSALVWTAITLALVALARQPWVEQGTRFRWLGIHLLAVLALVTVRAVFIFGTDPWLGWYPAPPTLLTVLMDSITNNFVAGWLLIGVAHAVVQSRKRRAREAEITDLRASLAVAQLDALRARLNPHFIFNALNSVAETMHRDVRRADHMLVSLSALLRDGLSNHQPPLRPLREELALVRHYLTMEQARLDERLRVSWDIDPQSLDIDVPVLILQPLVENAILHGIAPFAEPGDLSIRAEAAMEALRLCVENSVGREDHPRPSSGTGNGLRSIRDRLALLYGGAARLDVRTTGDDGIPKRHLVDLSIPLARRGGNPGHLP